MLDSFLTNYGLIIALCIRGLALFTCIAFILPLMLQQTRVRNGLKVLRWALFFYGVLTVLNNAVSSYLLLEVTVKHSQVAQNIMLIILNSVIVFLMAMIGYIMYHFQFTQEQISRHKRFDIYENKLARKKK